MNVAGRNRAGARQSAPSEKRSIWLRPPTWPPPRRPAAHSRLPA